MCAAQSACRQNNRMQGQLRQRSRPDGASVSDACRLYADSGQRSEAVCIPNCHAKTLFATHYHELNEMEKSYPRIKNYNVSVKEIDNKVIFLRKLERGGSEHSFGIHVAE